MKSIEVSDVHHGNFVLINCMPAMNKRFRALCQSPQVVGYFHSQANDGRDAFVQFLAEAILIKEWGGQFMWRDGTRQFRRATLKEVKRGISRLIGKGKYSGNLSPKKEPCTKLHGPLPEEVPSNGGLSTPSHAPVLRGSNVTTEELDFENKVKMILQEAQQHKDYKFDESRFPENIEVTARGKILLVDSISETDFIARTGRYGNDWQGTYEIFL